jgi:hypothetical protein
MLIRKVPDKVELTGSACQYNWSTSCVDAYSELCLPKACNRSGDLYSCFLEYANTLLCGTRNRAASERTHFVHHGDLTVDIANPSWQTRFSACRRIGTISVLWSHDAHGVPTIEECLQANTTVFRGSKRYDVRPVTMVDGRSTGVELDQFNDRSQRT